MCSACGEAITVGNCLLSYPAHLHAHSCITKDLVHSCRDSLSTHVNIYLESSIDVIWPCLPFSGGMRLPHHAGQDSGYLLHQLLDPHSRSVWELQARGRLLQPRAFLVMLVMCWPGPGILAVWSQSVLLHPPGGPWQAQVVVGWQRQHRHTLHRPSPPVPHRWKGCMASCCPPVCSLCIAQLL